GSYADPYRTNTAISVTWPAAFVSGSTPAVAHALRLGGDSAVNPQARALLLQAAGGPTATGWATLRVQRCSGDATDRPAILSLIAIGRWF
ncbi:hypothetical protein, partial [Rhodobacter maris]